MRQIVLVVAIVAALAACKKTNVPSVEPTTSASPPSSAVAPAAATEKPGDDPSQSEISISDEILKACGIDAADAHFAFNSANIRPQDTKILKQLADCFGPGGALAGRVMRLVGHADPRGDDEYNMVLGGRRAENVKGFIVEQGLAPAQATTVSRGEMDATGTDEASWSRDRRVDIVLAE